MQRLVANRETGKLSCRIYRKERFHAKAYITHARIEVVGSFALVGSSNLTTKLSKPTAVAPMNLLQKTIPIIGIILN